MHSYQHNIKTFSHATRHLTRVERSLYRDLIELYYDTEQPLPASNFDRLCRLVLAHSDDEKSALKAVLDEFFVLTGDVYSHNYCDEQIDKFKRGITAKAKAGIASAKARGDRSTKRKQARSSRAQEKSTPVEQSLNTCSTVDVNQEPVTSNQEPVIFIPPSQPEASNAVAIAPATRGRGTRLPSDWVLPKSSGEWAISEGFTREMILFEADKFRDYWISKSGKDASKLDWAATWRNWMRNAKTNMRKTFVEQKQDYLDEQAKKAYQPLLNADKAILEAWGLT